MSFLRLNLLLILAVFIICVRCASSENEKTQSIDSSDVIVQKTIPIPHGSVDVNANLIKYLKGDDPLMYLIKVEQVLGYGPAVPPIAPGTEMEVEITNKLLAESKIDSLSLPSVEKYNLRLYYQSGKSSGQFSNVWRIIKLTKIKN